MRILIGLVLAALFLVGAAFIGLAFGLLDSAIALAGSAALGSALIVAGIFIQLARIERYQREQVQLLKFLARQRKTE